MGDFFSLVARNWLIGLAFLALGIFLVFLYFVSSPSSPKTTTTESYTQVCRNCGAEFTVSPISKNEPIRYEPEVDKCFYCDQPTLCYKGSMIFLGIAQMDNLLRAQPDNTKYQEQAEELAKIWFDHIKECPGCKKFNDQEQSDGSGSGDSDRPDSVGDAAKS